MACALILIVSLEPTTTNACWRQRHDLDPDLDKTKTTITVLSSNSSAIRRPHYDSLSRGQFRQLLVRFFVGGCYSLNHI